jgi:hypothetical protein
MFFSLFLKWCHDTRQNEIDHNDIQHDDIKLNNKQNATLSIVAECCYAECHLR